MNQSTTNISSSTITTNQTNALLDDSDYLKQQASTLLGFWITFFPHYQDLPPAEMHPDLINLLESDEHKALNIVGFRDSGKSTLATTAYPIWLAVHKKAPFIIVSSDTDTQAELYIKNIKIELEHNEILHSVFGNMRGEEWGTQTLLLANGVRIMARSRGQKFRGLRHRQHRPKVVLIDDPEDRKWVREKKNRDDTEKWITGDVIPGMDRRGKIVILSNLLHTDCLGPRLKKNKQFTSREYPLIVDGECTWKAKYPTQSDLDKLKEKVGHKSWMREYMLKVVPEDGQVVHEEWIRRFTKIPLNFKPASWGAGVDLAISKKESADCTAIVPGISGLLDGKPKIYIGKRIFNKHFSLPETVDACLVLASARSGMRFFVESVGYQQAAIDEMKMKWLNVDAVRPVADKKARLEAVAGYIRDGTVEFPDNCPAADDLINSIVGLGIESHDDLCDAFCYLLLGLLKNSISEPKVIWL